MVLFSAVNLNENAWNVVTRPSPPSHSLFLLMLVLQYLVYSPQYLHFLYA